VKDLYFLQELFPRRLKGSFHDDLHFFHSRSYLVFGAVIENLLQVFAS